MHAHRKLLIVSLTVLCGPVLALAQKQVVRMGDDPPAPLDFRFPAGRDMVTVPIKLVGSAVLVPITLGDSATFWVTLDSGMPADRAIMLWDCPAVDSLGLTFADAPNIRIAGAGGSGQSFSPRIASGVTVNVGDLSINDVEIHSLPPMQAPYQRDRGVVGRMLLANFVIELDFDRLEMHLHRVGTFAETPGWSKLPLTFQRGNPVVEASVTLSGDSSLPVRLVLDLGAGHVLSLYTDADPRIQVPEPNISSTLGWGISGRVAGQIARVKSLQLGDQKLDHIVCSFPQSGQQGPSGLGDNHGNLGCGAMCRFNVVFDYAGSRLLIRPNASFNEPFEQEMAGLGLKDEGKTLAVVEVLPGSPAADAGIMEGDKIVRIDARPVSEVGYLEVRELLKRAGEKVRFDIQRGDRNLDIEITLQRLI